MTTDAELIKAARTDADAFGELYRRHVASVHAFLRSRAPERVAGELTAETFARAVPRRDGWLGSAVALRRRPQPPADISRTGAHRVKGSAALGIARPRLRAGGSRGQRPRRRRAARAGPLCRSRHAPADPTAGAPASRDRGAAVQTGGAVSPLLRSRGPHSCHPRHRLSFPTTERSFLMTTDLEAIGRDLQQALERRIQIKRRRSHRVRVA